uniref:Uncharacterized protein n=1 Tax=Rhizophora mucronata TaxID=61149 RepID=A0A2P2Q1U9_RHIMU
MACQLARIKVQYESKEKEINVKKNVIM